MFENFQQVVPIKKGFAACDMNLSIIAGKDFQRLPCTYGGIDRHQTALIGTAVIVTKLTSAIAFVRQHQTSRTPELKFRLITCSSTIINILRQVNHYIQSIMPSLNRSGDNVFFR